MNTLIWRNRRRLLAKSGGALLLFAMLALTGLGCDGGREGDRCNPLLSHSDCNDGLSCQQPATCAESYCCPASSSSSSNPFCNGQGCPQTDATPPAAGSGAAEAGNETSTGE